MCPSCGGSRFSDGVWEPGGWLPGNQPRWTYKRHKGTIKRVEINYGLARISPDKPSRVAPFGLGWKNPRLPLGKKRYVWRRGRLLWRGRRARPGLPRRGKGV